jgi:hypothetical protein
VPHSALSGIQHVSSAKAKIAAGVVLLALVIVPAPCCRTRSGREGALRAWARWKAAYLITTIGLHVALYGSLGVVAAFAVGPENPGDNTFDNW